MRICFVFLATLILSLALSAQEDQMKLSANNSEEEIPSCLTVAYIDIEKVFNEHPRTLLIKKEINDKIKQKELNVGNTNKENQTLLLQNKQLHKRLAALKPFYQQISTVESTLSPYVAGKTDSLEFNNLINQLLFSRADVLSDSPLNIPNVLEEVTLQLQNNQKEIAKNNLFIDNYKYATKEGILELEKKEVGEILKDIYNEIKTFAKNRNIGAVIRKEDVLYGEKAVNVTKDFINHLKKSKKYHKRGE